MIKKLVIGLAVVAMVFGASASMTNALTAADVTTLCAVLSCTPAQTTALMALVTPSTGGSMMSYTFNTNLTVGSRGADVNALQQILIDGGYLNIAAPTGYFGNATKAAVIAWQKASGISPAAGYVGAISRAALNSMKPATTPTTPTTPGTPTTPVPGMTTPGAAGSLTLEANPSPGSGLTVRAGDKMVPILGVKLTASNSSDIRVDRIRVNLGTSRVISTKVFQNLYLVDETGRTLASMTPFDGSVGEEGTTKFIIFNGINFVVPKGTVKVLTVKGDVFSSVASAQQTSYTFTVPANGAVWADGTNVTQLGPSTAFSNSVTIAASLTDSATLTTSLVSNDPALLSRQVIATEGSNRDEINELVVGKVSLKASGDDVKVRTWQVTIFKSGAGGAIAPTVFLYDDAGNQISSASLSGTAASTNNSATFSNLNVVIPKDTTKTFTLKAKITSANNTAASFAASTTGGAIIAENKEGTTVSPSGTASSSETVTVLDKGAEFTLVSKSISASGVPQTSGSNNPSTSTITASFTVRVKAVDSDVLLGTNASATPMFATSSTAFPWYVNDSAAITTSSNATSSSATFGSFVPSTNTISLTEGSTVDAVFTFNIQGRTSAGAALTSGLYASQANQLSWIGPAGAMTTNFMNGKTTWRTDALSFP